MYILETDTTTSTKLQSREGLLKMLRKDEEIDALVWAADKTGLSYGNSWFP